MEYIIQISEERSITKAAEKLFITQSALNQQLQKLEKELGLPPDSGGRNLYKYGKTDPEPEKGCLQPDPGFKRKREPAYQPGAYSGARRQYVHCHLPGIPPEVPGYPD